jgi:xanthine dehydrogenase accessory factor
MQLVPLCHLLGFRTVVVDDRAEFADPNRFPLANQLRVVPSFDQVFEDLPLERDTFVVVITRGHVGDLTVVREALRGQPGYIGMVGSRKKRETVFEALTGDGCSPTDLARVTSPIGLPIGAETPEEIAVSIVAQLIATRAAGSPRR